MAAAKVIHATEVNSVGCMDKVKQKLDEDSRHPAFGSHLINTDD
jgi:hypothetical protein